MRKKISFGKTGAFALLMSMVMFACSDMELKKTDVLAIDKGNIPVSGKSGFLCAVGDVAVGDVQFSSIVGNTFAYTFKVTNIGAAGFPLGQTFFQTYVSQDSTYDITDQPAGGAIFFSGPATLAAGASYTQSWSYNPSTPVDIHVYKYLIIKVAPRSGTIFECRTDNNTKAQRIGFDIPRNGLVAFYPFSGNANDVSGHNLNGTINGTVPAADRFGIANHAYSFDGVDDFITMGNPALLQLSHTLTVSGWFNVRAFDPSHSPGHGARAVITKLFFDPQVGFNPRKGYTLSNDFFGGGAPSASTAIYSSDSSGNVTSFLSSYVGNPITEQEWVFFCFVIDGTSYQYYHNGVLTHTYNTTHTILDNGSLGDLNIGAYGGGFKFNGWIDDIAIYNRALPQAEVTQLYRQTISK